MTLDGWRGSTVHCLHCGEAFRGTVDMGIHWDAGTCRKRTDVISGELVEDRHGTFHIKRWPVPFDRGPAT